MDECNICTEKTITIPCKFCEYHACKTCLSKYLLESINDAKCMNCQKPYTRGYLINIFSMYWYDAKYKPSRQQIMLDREKALFPDTMHCAEKLKENKVLRKQISQIKSEYDKQREQFTKCLDKIYQEIRKIKSQITTNEREIYSDKNKKDRVKTHFYGKCTINNCNGLINDNGHCINCNAIVCTKCFELDTDNHTCNPDILETIKLMRSDTKSCPKCTTPIYRSEGCYQMWCTNCHTTFHYNTGEILKERTHNPHYIEWLANQTLAQNQMGECGGDVLTIQIIQKEESNKVYKQTLLNIYRFHVHIEDVLIVDARYNVAKFLNEHEKKTLRAKFLIGDIDEKFFKQKLFTNFKQATRWTDVIDILNLFNTALTSILHEYLVKKEMDLFETQVYNIVKYINDEFIALSNTYKNSCYKFSVVQKNYNGSLTIVQE